MSRLFAALAAILLLGACEGGDIVIQPSTTDSSVDNSTNNSNNTNTTSTSEDNPCAVYEKDGSTFQGEQVGANCVYSPSFVDAGNNLTVSLRIPALPDDGAHIFEGSLFVGRTHDTDEGLANAGISRGGDGPTLTVEAGATLAFQSSSDFLIINRGSQLFAVGTREAPITFTSVSDIEGSAGPEDVQQWGGMVINGFGVTNKCDYDGPAGSLTTSDCHVDAEGAVGLDESQYGGDNNEDSSGRLEYVVVKHTGATVGNGDELNGISFGGVGSNTIVKNLEVYSTFDDGIEMFGGAVSFENFVGVYVRDDAIDIDEGWSGTITNALVIQSATDGNHCIEGDGIGSFDSLTADEVEATISQGINSRPTITGLTCIVSPNGAATATHDPGAGWRLREGIFPTINDSMVIGSFGPDSGDSNYCLRVDNRSLQAAEDGDLAINTGIFACAEKTRGGSLPNGTSVEAWAAANGSVFADINGATDATANANTDLQLLEGTPPVYSIDYTTMVVNGQSPAGSPERGSAHVGGLSLGSADWTAGWTYGIHEGNRAQPLWFE
ncbi:MAG: serine/threonine protein kinase [Gammaproteobacteria bacterium]|nr:serine/threonine protein kinase [Gammaproteobacteria bacterium]